MDDRTGGHDSYDPLVTLGACLLARCPKADLRGIDAREVYLCELRSALDGLSCPAELVRPGPGALALRVSYPGRLLDSADIVCVWTDGEWWFTWAEGRTIGPAEDVGGVAVAVYRGMRKGPVSS